jgi:hypothetical protein
VFELLEALSVLPFQLMDETGLEPWGEPFISALYHYECSVIDYHLKIVCAKVTIVAEAIKPNAKLTSD